VSQPEDQRVQQVGDLLITVLTLGVVVPRTVKFEGIVTGGAPSETKAPPPQ
jgi:hypothetical protein